MVKRIGDFPDSDDPKYAIKRAFAKNLQTFMDKKGWTQSELARQLTQRMPEGLEVKRFTVNTWMKWRSLPVPLHLRVLCETLGVEPDDLIPKHGQPITMAETTTLDIKGLQDGTAWIRINQRLPMKKVLEIQRILFENGA